MHIALNGLWISPYIYVYILRNHDTLCNSSSKKLVSKCPSLCFLRLPPWSLRLNQGLRRAEHGLMLN